MLSLSPLQRDRLNYQPKLPTILKDLPVLIPVKEELANQDRTNALRSLFPHTHQQPIISFKKDSNKHSSRPLKVGVVLSGGQAPGGHNVISGLFDALKILHPDSRLIGFCDGPNGIVKNKALEITADYLSSYRNQGGFDIIGSGRTKIETPDQLAASAATMKSLDLDGLVVIGGDDSNTNAAVLAEFFVKEGVKTSVIGVPKTIDGDLQSDFIEISFGFDTACKIYSEIIGNILRDALSAKKYYYFIKLMGRSASHITLECALKTQCNLALISEEIEKNKHSLADVTAQIADLICVRANLGKEYGVILIPEGVIEFIPEFKQLIQELNSLLAPDHPHAQQLEDLKSREEKVQYVAGLLSKEAKGCFSTLPLEIQAQLLLDRDAHGNVQVSKIETERLLIELVQEELKKRKEQGSYRGKFAPQPHFCGYEGRSGLPSNFDSQYCYALGHVAALLVQVGVTGYICCVRHLTRPVEEWEIAGVPIFTMLHLEKREGKDKPVIQKALVNLEGPVFQTFKRMRSQWIEEDCYLCPGPIQFAGAPELVEAPPLALRPSRSR